LSFPLLFWARFARAVRRWKKLALCDVCFLQRTLSSQVATITAGEVCQSLLLAADHCAQSIILIGNKTAVIPRNVAELKAIYCE